MEEPHGPIKKPGTHKIPSAFAANFKTPVLTIVGEKDYRVPLNNSIENFGLLQRLKIPAN